MLTSFVNEIQVNFKPKNVLSTLSKITKSKEIEAFLRQIWDDDIQFRERFYCIYLNRQNRILGYYLLSTGSSSGTVVDIKMIFQPAFNLHASSIIMAHNHPSGNLSPSIQDETLTKKVKRVCQDMDFCLLDHIILTYDSYYSFNDNCNL